MQRKQGLEEAEIQKLDTTAPEHLTDDKLLLSTLCAEGLARKHSVVGTMIALVSHQKPMDICQRRHERWNPCYPVRSVPGSGQALQ